MKLTLEGTISTLSGTTGDPIKDEKLEHKKPNKSSYLARLVTCPATNKHLKGKLKVHLLLTTKPESIPFPPQRGM